jgi:hypothetical protein
MINNLYNRKNLKDINIDDIIKVDNLLDKRLRNTGARVEVSKGEINKINLS